MLDIDLEELFANPAHLIAKFVTLDLANLEATMAEHTLLQAYVAQQAEDYKAKVSASKQDLDFIEAQVFRDERSLAKSIEETKYRVKEHIRVQRQMTELRELERRYNILKSFTASLEHRRDMIVQIAARQRQEIETYRHH